MTTFVCAVSPHQMVQLVAPLLENNQALCLSLQRMLEEDTLTPQKKLRALNKICGDEIYARFKQKIKNIHELVDCDLNVPILYNLLERVQLNYPRELSFENLTVWLYLNHPSVWNDLLALSFIRTSARKIYAYEILPTLFQGADYTDKEAIEAFELNVSKVCSAKGFGHNAHLILDDVKEGVYRAILYFTPYPKKVMTCKRKTAKSFKMKDDENALRMILVYNEAKRCFLIIGGPAEKAIRFQIVAEWAERFIGGRACQEVSTKTYNLDYFLTFPTALPTTSPLIHSIQIKSMTFGNACRGDVVVMNHSQKPAINPVEAEEVMRLFGPSVELKHLVLAVKLSQRTHMIQQFNVSLSKKSLTFGEASNCEDLCAAVKETLEMCHVLPH